MTPEQQRVFELTGLRLDHLQAVRHLEQLAALQQQAKRDRFNAAQMARRTWNRMEASA